jgi:hypothetical protein
MWTLPLKRQVATGHNVDADYYNFVEQKANFIFLTEAVSTKGDHVAMSLKNSIETGGGATTFCRAVQLDLADAIYYGIKSAFNFGLSPCPGQ